MNSLYNQLNSTSQNNTNPNQSVNIDQIKDMMNFIRNSQNPKMAFESVLQSNPQIQNIMNYVRQNGGDPRAAFLSLARHKGVNPDEILQLLR